MTRDKLHRTPPVTHERQHATRAQHWLRGTLGGILAGVVGGCALAAFSVSAVAQDEAAAPAAAAESGKAAESEVAPTAEEQAALDGIKGKIPGFIVFESNRGGQWHLYRMNADGTDVRRLTDVERADVGEPTYAAISPDGKTLAWEHRYSATDGEIWLMDTNGENERPLYAPAGEKDTRGSRPSWTPDGKLKFSRTGSRLKQSIWLYDFNKEEPKLSLLDKIMGKENELPKHHRSWQEEKIADFREMDPKYKVKRILIHEIAPDLNNYVAWSKYPGRGVWWLSLDGKKQEKIHGGCSPRVMPDGKNFIWVCTAGTFGIGSFTEPVQSQVLWDGPHPEAFDHTYFPYLTPDYKYLVYGACPPDQHDQATSNYQLYILELKDLKPVGEPVRLTFNKATDRYPVMWYEGMKSPAEPPVIKGNAHEVYNGPDDFGPDASSGEEDAD